MTVTAWRIVKAKNAASAFTGRGAKQAGGRWNSPGVAAVCVAGTTSLALLEMLVHLPAQDLLDRYVLFKVTFDDTFITTVDRTHLPRMWRRSPPSAAVQHVGDIWIAEASSAVLQVPSVIVPNEWNYMLNPAHSDFAKITIGPKQVAKFDPRLVKTRSK